MSIWIRRKDRDGKTYRYAVPFEPMIFLAIIAVLIALLMPTIVAVKAWFSH